MNKLNDLVHINNLIDIYGNLLTESQYQIVTMHFKYDLSLSEIADEKNISRAAVNDSLKKSVTILNNYEDTLRLLDKKNRLNSFLNKLIDEDDKFKRESMVKEYLDKEK